jgi:hypothetical protein
MSAASISGDPSSGLSTNRHRPEPSFRLASDFNK